MKRVGRIPAPPQARPGAGECRRDLRADVSGFADAHDDTLPAHHRLFDQLDPRARSFIQPLSGAAGVQKFLNPGRVRPFQENPSKDILCAGVVMGNICTPRTKGKHERHDDRNPGRTGDDGFRAKKFRAPIGRQNGARDGTPPPVSEAAKD